MVETRLSSCLAAAFCTGYMLAAHTPYIPRENWERHRLKQTLDLQGVVDVNPE